MQSLRAIQAPLGEAGGLLGGAHDGGDVLGGHGLGEFGDGTSADPSVGPATRTLMKISPKGVRRAGPRLN